MNHWRATYLRHRFWPKHGPADLSSETACSVLQCVRPRTLATTNWLGFEWNYSWNIFISYVELNPFYRGFERYCCRCCCARPDNLFTDNRNCPKDHNPKIFNTFMISIYRIPIFTTGRWQSLIRWSRDHHAQGGWNIGVRIWIVTIFEKN